MSNVDNTDLNGISEHVFEQARKHYVASVARWLSDVVQEELAEDLFVARTARQTIRDVADRVERGRLEIPEALR